jgi:hypothetical protein
MGTNNTNNPRGHMSKFERTVEIRDIHGNCYTQTVVDRNAAHTEQRRLAAERSNLRGAYTATMSQFVVLTPQEQSESGFYGRAYGVNAEVGHTDETGWTWLSFPEWKQVIKAFRSEVAAEDAALAARQAEARKAAFSSRR